MTTAAAATWWRGLGGLTRSGSPVEGLSWALYDFANTICVAYSRDVETAAEMTREPAIVPPGELPR